MRKTGYCVLLMAVVFGGALGVFTSGHAADQAERYEKVEVLVAETVGVFALDEASFGQVGPLAIGGGPVSLTVPYEVHSNTQYVDMAVCATDLWKAGYPDGRYGIFLDPNGPGATISGLGFTPSSWTMPFMAGLGVREVPPGDTYVWDFACTDSARFHSSLSRSFSWPVDVTVEWAQENYQLPQGGYEGYVKLIVYVVPDAGATDP